MAPRPSDITLSDEAEAWVPRIAGGISLGLARTFKIVEPKLVNPQTKHWESAFRLFDLLLQLPATQVCRRETSVNSLVVVR